MGTGCKASLHPVLQWMQLWSACGMPPCLVTNWPISPQEDVLNTQCGYDVRLKVVRVRDRAGGGWGYWDGEGGLA